MAVRAAMHQAGAKAIEQLLQCGPPSEQRTLPCSCGAGARYASSDPSPFSPVLGTVIVMRPYYLCSHCGHGQFPADSELDINQTGFSPGVRRMMALVGQQAPFDHGREELKLLAGREVTAKSVERVAEAIGAAVAQQDQDEILRAVQLDLPLVAGDPVPVLYVLMDGTGVPVRKTETAGRQGKTDGQPARTREVKLGCIFTQTTWDEEGYALRDPDSTTYVGSIETADHFGKRLYVEAWNRGWNRAETKVVIGDGAEWIWNIADQHFPGAIQIVDLFHARQHLWTIARLLHPLDLVAQHRWVLRHQPKLDGGKIPQLTAYLRTLLATATPALAELIRIEAAYFDRNAQRMQYPQFRAQHLFVGSGVIEAGSKTVIGQRLKQSGMFWTVDGANSIIALRCCYLNGRFEDYWETRRAA